jgi:hypothetical protein
MWPTLSRLRTIRSGAVRRSTAPIVLRVMARKGQAWKQPIQHTAMDQRLI